MGCYSVDTKPKLVTGSGNTRRWKKISQPNPHTSKTILWLEKWTCFSPNKYDDKSTGPINFTSNLSASIYTDKAHPGGASMVFADGHVDTQNFLYLVSSSNYPTAWTASTTTPLKKVYNNH